MCSDGFSLTPAVGEKKKKTEKAFGDPNVVFWT